MHPLSKAIPFIWHPIKAKPPLIYVVLIFSFHSSVHCLCAVHKSILIFSYLPLTFTKNHINWCTQPFCLDVGRVIGAGIGQWHWAWGNASAWNSYTNTSSEKESDGGDRRARNTDATTLLTTDINSKTHESGGIRALRGKARERATTPYKSFFLLLLFPRT